jgi:hypothetical protein
MTRAAIHQAIQFYRKANRVPPIHHGTELAELTSPGESPLQAFARGTDRKIEGCGGAASCEAQTSGGSSHFQE